MSYHAAIRAEKRRGGPYEPSASLFFSQRQIRPPIPRHFSSSGRRRAPETTGTVDVGSNTLAIWGIPVKIYSGIPSGECGIIAGRGIDMELRIRRKARAMPRVKRPSLSITILTAAMWVSSCVTAPPAMASKLDCHRADAELRKADRIVQLPIPTTGNLDADFNATQMQLAQREMVVAHVEISCGTNPKAIQAGKDLEREAQKRLEMYHNLPQS
jgi:hypothetical protein